jgi:hypothetical protein
VRSLQWVGKPRQNRSVSYNHVKHELVFTIITYLQQLTNLLLQAPHTARLGSSYSLNLITDGHSKVKRSLSGFYEAASPTGHPPFRSDTIDVFGQEWRADTIQETPGQRPLRLLSLGEQYHAFSTQIVFKHSSADGGGVRGISSLRILEKIMLKISNDPNMKPCDYFDMIAGTSTGG